MTDRTALIARLEKAAGPDRELDGDIWRAIDPVADQCWPHWSAEQRENMTPRFSASLDAALTLYRQPPQRIPADPRQACIEGLKQWA